MENFKTFFLFLLCFVSVSLITTRNYSVQKSMPSKYQNWNEHEEEIPFRSSKKSKRLLTKKRMFEVPKLPLVKKTVSHILHLKTDQMLYVKNKVFNGLPSKRPKKHVDKKRIGENLSKKNKDVCCFQHSSLKTAQYNYCQEESFWHFSFQKAQFWFSSWKLLA